MNELLTALSTKLGISTDQAGTAVGGLLDMIRKQTDDSEFSELKNRIPEAGALMDKADQAGGLMAGALSSLGSALGGSAGETLNLAGIFKSANLDADQGSQLISTFLNYIKEKCGPDLVRKLLEKVPELSRMFG